MSKEHEQKGAARHTAAQNTTDEKSAPKEPKSGNVQEMTDEIESVMEFFLGQEGIGSSLTAADRRRLVGAGVRNNGFIDKAYDIAIDNPQFMPPHFNVAALARNMKDLEDLRQLLWTLQQFLQAVGNVLLVHSDSCYRDALRIYSSLREQTRNRVEGAEPLFKALESYFRRGRKRTNEEPTEKQIEMEVKQLLHGKADGEIIVKNERPHLGGGLHEVIDHVHKDRSAFKETIEASEDEKK